MKRREFITSSVAGAVGAGLASGPASAAIDGIQTPARSTRKILIAGGGFGTAFIRYMAELTGKPRPKLLYLPTASADSPQGIIGWYRTCSPLNVEPSHQISFIASTQQPRSWDEVFLSVDGIVCSGGNTLNQQAIWKAQGIDVDPAPGLGPRHRARRRQRRLAVLVRGRHHRLAARRSCRSSQCLGFLKGSHSPHYDAEPGRRPLYQKLIASGQMKPGYACDNDAGIYFEDNTVKRVVATRDGAKVYYVSVEGGKVVEKVMEPERIA